MNKRGGNGKKRWRLDCGRVIALIGWLRREGRGREVARRDGDRGGARPGRSRERKGERKEKRGTDRRGRRVSGEEKREREGTGVGRCGEGEVGCWAARPKGKEVFFPFSFPNLFQFKLFLSNSNQNSSNLFTKFYKLYKLHSSNQKLCKAK
jgi:hypothetical protein